MSRIAIRCLRLKVNGATLGGEVLGEAELRRKRLASAEACATRAALAVLSFFGGACLLFVAPVAADAARPVFGVSDPRFTSTFPAGTLAQLGIDQVGISVAPGDEQKAWAIPASMGVLVVFAGNHWYESHPAAYAAAARRLVKFHPNVREIQVSNEPDLCLPWLGFWSDCLPREVGNRRFAGAPLDRYLDELAATHDALAGTGVKVLGFGFSPPWHHSDHGLSFWDPSTIAAAIDSWYYRRGPLTMKGVGPREDGEWISVRIRGHRYPRPIMDGFAYHPYAGWDDATTAAIYSQLEALELPGGTPALWWTELGMDTAWTSRRPCPWQGSEQEQAARVQAVLDGARNSPVVAGAFNFLLTDETDPNRFQSGLIRPDGTPKPAFYSFRASVAP